MITKKHLTGKYPSQGNRAEVTKPSIRPKPGRTVPPARYTNQVFIIISIHSPYKEGGIFIDSFLLGDGIAVSATQIFKAGIGRITGSINSLANGFTFLESAAQ